MAEVYGISYEDSGSKDTAKVHEPRAQKKRSSRRLSKPRTNSSSAIAVKPRISLGNLDSLTRSAANSVADLLSPNAERQDFIRGSELSPQSTPNLIQQVEDFLPKEDHGGTQEVMAKSGRIQRTGTKLRSHLSFRSNPSKAFSTADTGGILKRPEDYEWLKEKAQKDLQAMRDHRPSQATDEDREQHTLAPYRRKSLLTPGLATRGGDILRKPGATAVTIAGTDLETQARYYNSKLSPDSPLTRIASLDVPVFRDLARAATPSEKDYGKIGGYLHVANGGAESPSLSLATRTDHTLPLWRRSSLAGNNQYIDTEPSLSPRIASNRHTIQIIDNAIYDPYAEDVGNPWLDECETPENITAAINQASQLEEKRLPKTPVPTYYDEIVFSHRKKASVKQDYFNCISPPFQDNVRKLNQEVRSANEVRSRGDIYQDSLSAMPNSQRDAGFSEPNLPSTQDSMYGALTPLDYDKVEQIDVQRPRLEMVQFLENMMAASRYTPVEHSQKYWKSRSSSTESEIPSLSWGRNNSSSNTSLASEGKRGYPATPNSNPSQASFTKSSRNPKIRKEQQPRPPNSAPFMPLSPSRGQYPFDDGINKELPLEPLFDFPSETAVSPVVFVTHTNDEDIEQVPVSASPEKASKQGTKKLQKKPPRPKSMPMPVEHIVISGHSPTASPSIPDIPLDMRVQLAERWNSRPVENREPTIPNVSLHHNADYFSQPRHSRSNTAPQFSPNAPPVPKKSARRMSQSARFDSPDCASKSANIPTKHQKSSTQRNARYLQPAESRQQHQRMITSKGADNPQYSGLDRNNTDSSRVIYPGDDSGQESETYLQERQSFKSPGTTFSGDSRSRTNITYQQDIAIREDESINWAQVRMAWAARRRGAGDSLQSKMAKAKEDIATTAKLSSVQPTTPTRGPPSNLPANDPYSSRDEDTRRHHQSYRVGGQPHLKADYYAFQDTSPYSQPSAAPSPLWPTREETSRARYRHDHLEYEETTGHLKDNLQGSYFPRTKENIDDELDESGSEIREGQKSSLGAGRYEGGLEFGYEQGKGVGGSAGTRSFANESASRKGGPGNLAEGFGVDLSDVPIFVTKIK